MILYPAIDLMGGRVVRLAQGRFEEATFYETLPHSALEAFAGAGAEWAHVVDLDGARAGTPVQHDLLAELAKLRLISLQVAGGFRTRDQIARLLDAGVERVVIGSLAVRDPEAVRGFLAEFGAERITLALDVHVVDEEPLVATSGWTESSGRSLWDVASEFLPVRHLLVTDIGRDGMMSGPNMALLSQVAERLPTVDLQASGGVSSLDDLKRLPTAGAIVGRAIWEGQIDLREAVLACR
jgi:phosphoribosylformimino-5-aminoimidazole carboxamide ribotide isomerase